MRSLCSTFLVCLAALSISSRPVGAEEIVFGAKGINFTGAELVLLLPKYSELTGRNLLRSPMAEIALKKSVSFVNETPLTKTAAIEMFEEIFATNDVRFVAVGDRLVKVLHAKEVKGHDQPSKQSSPATAPTTEEVIFPAKAIVFKGATLGMVLTKYAELAGRKISRSPKIESSLAAPVFFFNQTPLARSELIQAFEEIFALNGIGFLETGNEGTRAVPVHETRGADARVPKPSTPNTK